MPADTTPPKPKPSARRWSPRFLQGTDTCTWAKVLFRNRFAVHPKYWYIAGIVSVASTMNLVLRWVQHGLHGDRIAATHIDPQPLFVIGHWRTGTTLLHNLLGSDPHHRDWCSTRRFHPLLIPRLPGTSATSVFRAGCFPSSGVGRCSSVPMCCCRRASTSTPTRAIRW